MSNAELGKDKQATTLGDLPTTFNEDRNSVFYHDIRVFIFGTDVTPYLSGSVRISKCDVDGVSTCSFSLSNQFQVFEITPANLSGTFRGGDPSVKNYVHIDTYAPDGRASESAKRRIYNLKKTKATPIKWSGIQSFGPGPSSIGGKPNFSKTARDASSADSTTVERYPFNVGSLVFHKNDPVRVFVKNPFTRSKDSWTCEFTGYLTSKPYSQDYVNGQSMITITASDIRDLMKMMRTQKNPAAQVGSRNTLIAKGNDPGTGAGKTAINQGALNAGFFGDQTSNRSTSSHVLGSRNWLESIKYLLFGTQQDKSNGVCELSMGETFFYDPASATNGFSTLKDWNDLVIFGGTRKFLSNAAMMVMGMGTYFGGDFSPDKAKVHFLVPSKEAPNSNLIQYNIDANIAARVDFTSRYDLIHTLCTNIDYQMYVTGMGDIVFEFPMYDFLPKYYGPFYESLYNFQKHIVSDNINDESGQVCTALRLQSDVLFANASNPATQGQPLENGAQFVTTVFSNVMASRVGVAEQTITRPGISDGTRRVQVAMIEFMKILANFNSFEMNTTYRPFIGVNRPMMHLKKRRFGITNKVEYVYNIRADVTLQMDLNFVRKEEGDNKYRFVTGGEAVPISYSTLYDKRNNKDGFLEKQGVVTNETVNKKPGPPSSSASKPNTTN